MQTQHTSYLSFELSEAFIINNPAEQNLASTCLTRVQGLPVLSNEHAASHVYRSGSPLQDYIDAESELADRLLENGENSGDDNEQDGEDQNDGEDKPAEDDDKEDEPEDSTEDTETDKGGTTSKD